MKGPSFWGPRPAQNRFCPISVFWTASRPWPTCWLASLAPQGEGEQNCAAALRPVCRRPAAVVRGCLSSAAPFAPQLGPIVEPFFDLALETALGRIVELPAAERFREIILTGKRLGGVMVVFVVRAVAFALHQLGR